MLKELTITFADGEDADLYCDTMVTLIGDEFVTEMKFGGRDGSSDDFISLDTLRHVFKKTGKDVE